MSTKSAELRYVTTIRGEVILDEIVAHGAQVHIEDCGGTLDIHVGPIHAYYALKRLRLIEVEGAATVMLDGKATTLKGLDVRHE